MFALLKHLDSFEENLKLKGIFIIENFQRTQK